MGRGGSRSSSSSFGSSRSSVSAPKPTSPLVSSKHTPAQVAPSLMGNMAATAGGVAMGSVIGNGLSRMFFGSPSADRYILASITPPETRFQTNNIDDLALETCLRRVIDLETTPIETESRFSRTLLSRIGGCLDLQDLRSNCKDLQLNIHLINAL